MVEETTEVVATWEDTELATVEKGELLDCDRATLEDE